jgi:hypothetical protein
MAHLQTFAEWECLVIILEAGIREAEQVNAPDSLISELEDVYRLTIKDPAWLSTDESSQRPHR